MSSFCCLLYINVVPDTSFCFWDMTYCFETLQFTINLLKVSLHSFVITYIVKKSVIAIIYIPPISFPQGYIYSLTKALVGLLWRILSPFSDKRRNLFKSWHFKQSLCGTHHSYEGFPGLHAGSFTENACINKAWRTPGSRCSLRKKRAQRILSWSV